MLVDGVVHLGDARSHDALACGLVVYDRSLDAVMRMFVDGADNDVDCMTCLVTETRERKNP